MEIIFSLQKVERELVITCHYPLPAHHNNRLKENDPPPPSFSLPIFYPIPLYHPSPPPFILFSLKPPTSPIPLLSSLPILTACMIYWPDISLAANKRREGGGVGGGGVVGEVELEGGGGVRSWSGDWRGMRAMESHHTTTTTSWRRQNRFSSDSSPPQPLSPLPPPLPPPLWRSGGGCGVRPSSPPPATVHGHAWNILRNIINININMRL